MIRIATAILLGFNVAIASQNFELNIKSGPFTPAENFHSDWSQAFNSDPSYKVIQFESIPLSSELKAMEKMGLFFEEYLPINAYLVSVPGMFSFNRLTPYSPRSIVDFDSRFKHDANFGVDIPAYAKQGADQVRLTLILHKYSDEQDISLLLTLSN